MECMLQRVRKSIMFYESFYDQNKHGQSTEANVMSSTAFRGRILLAARKKGCRKWNENAKQTGICMMWRLLKWIRRENG